MKPHDDSYVIYARKVNPWMRGETRYLGQPVPDEVRWERAFSTDRFLHLHIESGWVEEPDNRIKWVIMDDKSDNIMVEGEMFPVISSWGSYLDIWAYRILEERWDCFGRITQHARIDRFEDPAFADPHTLDSITRLERITGFGTRHLRV